MPTDNQLLADVVTADSTIEHLRTIVKNRAARVLFFEPPAVPVAESLEDACTFMDGNWGFGDFRTVPEEEYERERLLVDMQTANVMVMVYDALKPETRVKADRLMLTKSGFLKVSKVAWGAVK